MVEDPIRWLLTLERFGIKLGLDTMRALLRALGNPETACPAVLVGGTNGKGSVAALLDGMLLAAGRKVGLTTSPHLVRLNERIRVGGSDIDTEDLERHLAEVRRTVESSLEAGLLPAHPSFFEVVTATAFLAFRHARAELALLEVGLGGRLDATNVADAVVSVIVSVDLDHTDRLGTTLERIAFEKAGIVKPGRVLVSGVEQPEAREVLREACARAGSTLVEVHRHARVIGAQAGRFSLETELARYDDLATPLPGRHQVHNASVAIVALEALCRATGLSVSPESVRRGIARARWPGRLQWIDGTPRLLLDGAHNPAGARALAGYLAELGGPRPVLVFGAMKDKDIPAILGPLAACAAAIVLTRPPVERAADPDDLLALLEENGPPAEASPDAASGLARARELAGPDGVVVVAGSLFLVGETLRLLEA